MIVYLAVLHFIADFLLQPRSMGRGKGEISIKGISYLSLHLLIQFIIFFAGLSLLLPYRISLEFAAINTICHGIIDISIWKAYPWTVWIRRREDNYTREYLKKTWRYWDDYLFYWIIGLDQLLHFSTIVFLWYYITDGGCL